MKPALKKSITKATEKAEAYCSAQGFEQVFTYDLSEELLEAISKRTESLPAMYFASLDMLKDRTKNGCYLLKKGDVIYGHIFAHKHKVHNHYVYERCSLWVHPEHRNHNLGLLLMNLLTHRYQKHFLISIAQEPTVHYNNQLLGMKHISLAEMSSILIESLEEIGKLRDEYRYKYYVNPYFEQKINQFNKVLNNINKK